MTMTSFPISISRAGWNNLFPKLKSSISQEVLQWRPDFSREALNLSCGREKTIIRSIFLKKIFESCSVSRPAAKGKENQVKTSLEVCLTGNHLKAVHHWKSGSERDLKGKGRAAKKLLEVLRVIWEQLITQLRELSSGKAGDRSGAARCRSQNCHGSGFSVWGAFRAPICTLSESLTLL